jgi:hypothetical protein
LQRLDFLKFDHRACNARRDALASITRVVVVSSAMRLRMSTLAAFAAAILACAIAAAAPLGTLKLDVLGDVGAGAKNPAHLIGADGKDAGQVTAGGTVQVPPGTYQLVLPIVGGQITKKDVTIEAGRTHTVLITNVSVLEVDVKDRSGQDPGFGVTVTTSDEPHRKITSFLSGEKWLFAPAQVDVKVDAPPQGYYWHAVALKPDERARLTLGEVTPAELDVQTVLSKLPINESTRVVIYHAGTQQQVTESAPGRAHHFSLDAGDYDIYVENRSGKGKPYGSMDGVHLDSGAKVERTVPLD